MRAMKDSGIEWIGEIPEDWNLLRMKSCISKRDGGAWGDDVTGENDTICLRIADFDYSKFLFKDTKIEDLTKRHYNSDVIEKLKLNKDDILIEKSGGGEKTPVGRTVIFDKDYTALFANFMERLRCSNFVFPKFMQYVFVTFYKNDYTRNYIKQTTGIQNLDLTSMLAEENVPVPTLYEQQKISAFLDSKCTEIDSVISKTKATIEEYKKLKQSVITQAVTKGIIPNRPMKDSGIEWIGEIPQEWEIKKFKYIANNRNDKVTDNNGNNYFALENVVSWNGVLIHTENDYDINGAIICKKGDVVFGKLRPYLAKVFQVDFDRCCSSEFAVFYNFHGYSRYYYYVMLSKVFVDTVNISTYGVKMPRANIEFIRNMYIPIFNVTEQQEIANYLDEKCSEIDKLIAKKEQLLTEMENYKKAVIYEYVTGKKEIF